MGFACAWIAVKGKSPQELLKEFDLRRTGKFEEGFESDFNATERGQWYILIANRDNVIPLVKANFERLSRNHELVFCQVEEHVMFSCAGYSVNGTNKYFVSHDSEKGIMNLDEKGSFPAQYDEIRARLIEEQNSEENKREPFIEFDESEIGDGNVESPIEAEEENEFEVDYIFDIPVELAKSLTGFRHDEFSKNDKSFEILEKKPASFLKRLLGNS
jgi:hypothetical protein